MSEPPSAADAATAALRTELGGLARGGLLNLVSSIASQAALLALTVLLARLVGRDEAGVYFQSFAFLSLLSLLSLLGFRGGLTRFVAIHLANGDVPRVFGTVRLALALSLPASALLGAGLFAAAPWLANTAFSDDRLEVGLRFVAVALPAVTLQDGALSATQGFRTMKPFALVGLLFEPCTRLVLTAALLLGGSSVRGALVALTISSWAGGLVAAAWLRRLMRAARQRAGSGAVIVEAGPLLRYSMVAWVASLASTGLIWADTIILGLTVSSGVVGVYNAAARLVTLAVFVVNPINAAFAPRIANLFARNELGLLRQTYSVATSWIVRLSLPAFAVLMVLPTPLLDTFFGRAFTSGASVVVVLAVGQLFNAATGPCGMIINMSGRNRLNLLDNVAVLVLNVVLNLLLIPRFGITGAAVAWSASLAVVNVVRVLQVRSFLSALPFDLAQAKAFLAAAAAGAVAWSTAQLVDGGVGTVAAVGGAGCVYLALLVVLGLPEDDRVLARTVIRRRRLADTLPGGA